MNHFGLMRRLTLEKILAWPFHTERQTDSLSVSFINAQFARKRNEKVII